MTREEAIRVLGNLKLYHDDDNDILEACDTAIEALQENESLARSVNEASELLRKKRPHGEWIPCSERLPEENKTVIASTEYGVFPEAQYTKKYGWEWAYESGADYWEELEGVTAWMPLPEPYKKEGDSDA